MYLGVAKSPLSDVIGWKQGRHFPQPTSGTIDGAQDISDAFPGDYYSYLGVKRVNQRTRRLIVVVLSAVLAGCATLQDVVNSKDKGTSETYAVSMDQAKEIAETVLRWDDASTVIHKSSEGNFMYARVSNWLGSFGNRDWVGIWFDRLKPDETKVTVVTKRYNQLAAAIALTETTFHKRFAEAVQIVKEGKPLPIAPPVPEPVTSESPLESP